MPTVYNVSDITNILSGTIQRNVLVQGEVLTDGPPKAFYLVNESNKLRCFIPQGVMAPTLEQGQVVVVDGKITLFSSFSQYQITVSDIQVNVTEVGPTTESNTPRCQCPGCESCRPQGGNQSCLSLLDPEYELCPNCYRESPDREDRVAQSVYAYFDALGGNGFSPEKEWQIQMGSENRIADVVLTNENKIFFAIAECKGSGFVGDGREQLYSYLSATDTRFGVFANRADPNHWEFYENRRQNQFDRVRRDEFEDGVVKGVPLRKQLKNEIKHLKNKILELKNLKCELEAAVNKITQTKHNLTERTSNLTEETKALENYKSELHEEIHRKLDHLLEEKMQRLESPLSELKIELQKRSIVNWFKNLFSKKIK